MTRYPLKFVWGNLLFAPDAARAALFRVEMISYPFLPDAEKLRWHDRLSDLAHAIEADFSLWRVTRGYPTTLFTQEAHALLDQRHADPQPWTEYLAGHAKLLQSTGPWTSELYLAVSLAGIKRRLGLAGWQERASGVRAQLDRRRLPIGTAELARLEEAETHVLHRVQAHLPARRASTREIQWLLARPALRGLREPTLDDQWAPAALQLEGGTLEPLETDVWDIAGHATLREAPRGLTVETEHGTSHQALLAMGAPPERAPLPGGTEILHMPLEQAEFPVDIAVHVRWVSNQDAGQTVKRRVMDADNNYRDQLRSATGPLSYAAEENRGLARELDARMREPDRPPLLQVRVGLAVGAPDAETLERRVERLRHLYGRVVLRRPIGRQAAMYLDHTPRADAGSLTDYRRWVLTDELAAMMIIGTHTAGSQQGPLLGRVAGGPRRPVLQDVTEAPRIGRSPSILICGALGSGKTVAAQLIAYQAALRGSLLVDVDPKPDHQLHALLRAVREIELSGDPQYRGLLDPLVVAPDALREDLAHSYLSDLLPPAKAEAWETHILKAVKTALTKPDPCLVGVLRELWETEDPDARACAEALAVRSESGLAQLGFSDGTTGGVSRADATVIRAHGLSLPDDRDRRYDPAERISLATLKLVAAYAMGLVRGDRTRHKVVLFDEAWFLLGTPDGRRLLDRLNRMGRAENATLILATQQLGDAKELEALVGTRMVFRQENREQARKALALLSLDPTDDRLADRLVSLPAGRCLMQDLERRTAEVQVDTVYPWLLEALDTTPGAREPALAESP